MSRRLLHAVTRRGDAAAVDLDGLHELGVEVTAHTAHDVTVWSTAADLDEPRRLLDHGRVLRELARRGPVVPIAPGTVVGDDDRLRSWLDEQRSVFARYLDRLAQLDSFIVVARLDETYALRDVLEHESDVRRRRRRRGAATDVALGERVVAAVSSRGAAVGELVAQALAPVTAELDDRAVGDPLVACDLRVLVERASRRRFDATVDALGERLSPAVTIEVTGPAHPVRAEGVA